MIGIDEAGVILAILKQLDPGGFVTVDKTAKGIWADALNTQPAIGFETAAKAARRLAATGERFPRPAEFRAYVFEQTDGLPSPAEAKAQIERSLRENYPGHPPKVELNSTVYAAAKQIGGTYRLRVAQSERETAQWWREFDQAYATLRRQHVAPSLPDGARALTEGASQ